MTEAQQFQPVVPVNCLKAYVNGFGIGYSKTECGIVFMLNQEPAIQVLLPFPVVLALIDNLKEITTHYEATTKLKIPRIESIQITPETSTKG